MTPSEKEEVMAFQRKVERYWGIHLETKFSSAGGAPFSMRWGEVYLDEEELGRLDWDGRVREVGHELGHRAQEPGTAGGEVLWEAIATQEGVEQPADFCNVMSDMVIEHGNTVGHSLGVCPWAKPYSRGLRKTLAEHSEGRPPSVELLGEVDRMTLAEFRGKKVEAAPPALAERCYRLLFKAKLSKPEMIRRLAREAGHLFKDPMDYGESWNTGDGSEEREAGEAEPDRGKRGEGKPGRILIKPLSVTGEATPSEEGEIASALVQLYGVEGITKETKELLRERAKRALRTLTAWQAYTNVVPIMKVFAGKHEKPLEVATSKWNVGMPIRKLDLKATVSKYGMILPGITTLSRTEIKRTTTSSGLANLCLVFDGSGSMSGEKVERAIEATLGLIETARHFKDMFSLISIGGDFRKQSISDRLVFEPSYDYATPFNALLDFEGYGDCITNQMMNKAVEFAKRTDKQLTMVMSDNLWPDDFCKYSRQLEELLKHGPVIFVVFTKDEGWGNTLGAIAGKENATAVLVEDPTEPFTWAALEPAWKQLQKKEDSIFLSA